MSWHIIYLKLHLQIVWWTSLTCLKFLPWVKVMEVHTFAPTMRYSNPRKYPCIYSSPLLTPLVLNNCELYRCPLARGSMSCINGTSCQNGCVLSSVRQGRYHCTPGINRHIAHKIITDSGRGLKYYNLRTEIYTTEWNLYVDHELFY